MHAIVGVGILASMEGVSVTKHSLAKKKPVTNMASYVYVSVVGDRIEIDPQQLYQRLLVAGIGNIESFLLRVVFIPVFIIRHWRIRPSCKTAL